MKKLIIIALMLIGFSAMAQQQPISILDTTASGNSWKYTWNGTYSVSVVDSAKIYCSVLKSKIYVSVNKMRIVGNDTILGAETIILPYSTIGNKKWDVMNLPAMKKELKKEIKKLVVKKKLHE